MMTLKEHSHTLLIAAFLVGVLLVFGSFEAHFPDTATAASTPGQQSSNQSRSYYVGGLRWSMSHFAYVTYTGEARKKDGTLLTSSDILKPGDKINVSLILNGGFNITGMWKASPATPWVSGIFTTRISGPYKSYYGFCGDAECEKAAYETAWVYHATNNNAIYDQLCYPGSPYQTNIGCVVVAAETPPVSLAPSAGLSCNKLSPSDTLTGVRTYNTTCTVVGPVSAPTSVNITANIGEAPFAPISFEQQLQQWIDIRETSPYGDISPTCTADPSPLCNAKKIVDVESGRTSYSFCDLSEDKCNALCEYGDERQPINCTNICSTGEAICKPAIDAQGILPFSPQTFSWSIDVAPNPPGAPTLTFIGNPTTINQGESAKLEWDSKNTESCEGNFETGGKTSGKTKVSPPTTTAYDIVCKGPGGKADAAVTITVHPLPPICPSGQTQPYRTCDNNSCAIVNDACGVTTCSNDSQCVSGNQPPVADAKISACPIGDVVCIQAFSDAVTVTRGAPTQISLSADGSSDPDGWTSANGVSNGGNCRWNSDLNQGTPTFEQKIPNPASPGVCSIFLGTKTFNDAPGTYTYQVLQIMDNKGAVSNIDTVKVEVVEVTGDHGFKCNSSGQCVFGGVGQSCQTNANCPGSGFKCSGNQCVIGGGGASCTSNASCGGTDGCVGNCGGGDGGSGCTNPANCPSIPTTPTANQLGSDTGFFCPSRQVQMSWQYSDPNNDPQASFRLQLDDDANFGSMIVDVYKDSSDKLFIVPPNVLAFGTKYYFRVAVKDSTGAWSNWSSSANFTTPANCVPPADFSLNSSNNISVNVTGIGAGTSNSTTIRVAPAGGFSSAVTLTPQSISPNLPGAAYNFATASLDQAHFASGFNFRVTIPGSTVPGNYTIKIKGKSGGIEKFIDVLLHVNSTSPVFREI